MVFVSTTEQFEAKGLFKIAQSNKEQQNID
jgi:hypothetical protein